VVNRALAAETRQRESLTKVELVRRAFAMFRAVDQERLTADQRELVTEARNDEVLNDLEFLSGRST